MRKHITASLLGLGLLIASLGAASAHGYSHHGHGHWGHGHWYGGGCCGGVLLPFGLGLLGGYMWHEAITPPMVDTPETVPVAPQAVSPAALCARQYRSYNPATGLFTSTDGTQKICPYLK